MTHTEPLKDLCYLQGEMSRTSYQRVWILSTPTFLYRSSHIFKFIEIPINFSVPRLQCLRLERLCQLVQICKNHGKTARKKPFDGKNWRQPTISTKSCKIWARQKNGPKTTKSNRLHDYKPSHCAQWHLACRKRSSRPRDQHPNPEQAHTEGLPVELLQKVLNRSDSKITDYIFWINAHRKCCKHPSKFKKMCFLSICLIHLCDPSAPSDRCTANANPQGSR